MSTPKTLKTLIVLAVVGTVIGLHGQEKDSVADSIAVKKGALEQDSVNLVQDTVKAVQDTVKSVKDTVKVVETKSKGYRLTEEDYKTVAEKYGLEPAMVHAVVEIEAGPEHTGFTAPGVPIINFDINIFRRFSRKAGIRANVRKRGGSQQAEYASLNAARRINKRIADESTFWGMFQIGGFNWRNCGTKSIDDFVAKMSESELSQLNLFIEFITRTDLIKYLKAKNWSAFASRYNGPRYARNAYHTRLARAYNKYKNR